MHGVQGVGCKVRGTLYYNGTVWGTAALAVGVGKAEVLVEEVDGIVGPLKCVRHSPCPLVPKVAIHPLGQRTPSALPPCTYGHNCNVAHRWYHNGTRWYYNGAYHTYGVRW